MASEAQRLIGISLTKIAQSRTHRGGVSLHKNLLIATVLQKARYIFMEEAYNMVHYQQRAVTPVQQLHHHHQHHSQQQVQMHLQVQMQPQQTLNLLNQPQPQRNHPEAEDEDDLVGLTVEEAGIDQTSPSEDTQPSCNSLHDYSQPGMTGCLKCASNQNQNAEKDKNKENLPPGYHSEQLTYFDLDTDNDKSSILKERSTSTNAPVSATMTTTTISTTNATTSSSVCLKRRRVVTEWEIEEAVQSILPKRRCSTSSSSTSGSLASLDSIISSDSSSDEDDSVFLDNATQLSESVARQFEESSSQAETNATNSSSMDSIDRITSLVSIFSFGMTSSTPCENSTTSNATSGNGANGKLSANSRAVSTPDLCSSQAKEGDTIQQRPFLAMTV